ncbi:HsdR family type I site-specific deoxyribonuclease [Mycoplasma wenyonii str. Massachusetts]|uniref:Type I restriction enzyme endonuclease subunit n=1 Tax=Mycoplasma wenyonii (strain Massachusetts) TaxID=1197325 RepID=I6ZFA2_MYCWM|nr:HsdR family type I site-specific deoxyribonuclease [Mycoplasma wenyonii str. Massachusetts]
MEVKLDLVIYINGIPLFVWEFKDPKKDLFEKDTLLGTEQLIRYNEKAIPELFRYNAFCVICNGLEGVKYGVSWGEYGDYKEWKRVFKEDKPINKNILIVTIRGLFNKSRIVEILENFICFSDTDPKKKIVCRYPQYFGATKLLESIENNCKKDTQGTGKGGIYFGATGCGKSYTMLFLSRLLLKSNKLNRPTILLITDRRELNYQLRKLFYDHKEYLQCEEVVGIEKSKEHLKRTLANATPGGIYLTNIQKFLSIDEVLTEKWNFVCISDEAHRTQDSLSGHYKRTFEGEGLRHCKHLAQVLRDSLPNATYVGFTATPRDKTLEVFGSIVDVYSMEQSKYDGFTVQILTNSKETKLRLDERIAREINSIYREMESEGTNKEKIEEDQESRTRRRKALSSPKRLRAVTENIIEDYERRVSLRQTVREKAMIVADNKEAAFIIYQTIKEKRPTWFANEDPLFPERSMVNLVISVTPEDREELKEVAGDSGRHNKLANEFKKEKSSFKIAIVCRMWLTGFDVPSLDLMYLDRYVKGHELIQAISRVNRSFLGKRVGMVICYLPLKKRWIEAFKALEEMGEMSRPVEIDELAERLKMQIGEVDSLFSVNEEWGEGVKQFFWGSEVEKMVFVRKIAEWINKQTEQWRVEILNKLKKLHITYQQCKSYENLEDECKNAVMLFEAIKREWKTPTRAEKIQGERIDALMKHAFDVHGEIRDEGDEILDMSFNYSRDPIDMGSYFSISPESLEDRAKMYEKINNLTEQLNDKGEKGQIFSEKLKDLVSRINSSWDEQTKYEQIKQEIQQIIQEAQTLLEEGEEEKKERKLSDLIYSKVLVHVRDKYAFNFQDEKMRNLSEEIRQIGDKYIKQIDWDKKIATRSRITKALDFSLKNAEWPPFPPEKDLEDQPSSSYSTSVVIKETIELLIYVFKNIVQEEKKEE